MKTSSSRLLLIAGVVLILFAGAGYTGDNRWDTREKAKAPTATVRETSVAKNMYIRTTAGDEINWQVISSGGIMGAISTSYIMDGTVGQAVSGYGYSTNYGLGSGFWFAFGYSETSCCQNRVGDANGLGGDEPTIGDVSVLIDALFISGDMGVITCLAEADVNQSGGNAPQPIDITIGDISTLIDYLFITGPLLGLPECL